MQFLLMYRSLTYAQRCVRILEKERIPASVIRAPRIVNSRGCGYSAVLSEKHGPAAAAALRRQELPPEKVYRRRDDGTLEEAEL